jgi:hypothetical protein
VKRPSAVGLAIALALALAPPPSTQAAYEPLGASTTTLTLAGPFAAFLKTNAIKLAAVAPAQVRGQKLTLPLAEGKWDPTTGKGQIESDGAIVLRGKGRKLPLKGLTVKANRQPLTAKLGGGQLKLATSEAIDSRRAGFGAAFEARALLLTAKAATRLNKKLRPREPFQANQLLGTLRASSRPALMSVLPEGRLTLDPAAVFLAELASLHVSLNPVFPAEHPGPFTFPIAPASTISPDGTQGTIRTEGELEALLLGSGQLFWGEQWFDLYQGADLLDANLQPSPPYAGKQDQAPLLTLSLAGAQVTANPATRSVSIQGASLTFTQTAADQLNQLLAAGKSVFAAGEALGSVSLTATGQ